MGRGAVVKGSLPREAGGRGRRGARDRALVHIRGPQSGSARGALARWSRLRVPFVYGAHARPEVDAPRGKKSGSQSGGLGRADGRSDPSGRCSSFVATGGKLATTDEVSRHLDKHKQNLLLSLCETECSCRILLIVGKSAVLVWEGRDWARSSKRTRREAGSWTVRPYETWVESRSSTTAADIRDGVWQMRNGEPPAGRWTSRRPAALSP